MAQREVSLVFRAFDRRNERHLYLKADGKRFGDSQTFKICTDIKYDVSVLVKPSLQTLHKLVIGGEDVLPDSSDSSDSGCEYKFSWLTSGYTPTKKGCRMDLAIVYHFESAEVTHKIQVKFYSPERSSHLTWGTSVTKMDLTVKGLDHKTPGSASPHSNLVPSNVQYK